MDAEWDPDKARENRRKHGVDFPSAATVLYDPLALTVIQERFGEDRYLTIGADLDGRVLVVVHVVRDGLIRIISARRPTTHERRHYQEMP